MIKWLPAVGFRAATLTLCLFCTTHVVADHRPDGLVRDPDRVMLKLAFSPVAGAGQFRLGKARLRLLAEDPSSHWLLAEFPASEESSRLAPEELRSLPEVIQALPVYRTMTGLYQGLTDEICVRFQPSLGSRERQSLLDELDLDLLRDNDRVPGTALLAAPGCDEQALWSAVQALRQRPEVVYAHPNCFREVRKKWQPDDPLFSNQWSLDNVGQEGAAPDADVNAPKAWTVGHGDPELIMFEWWLQPTGDLPSWSAKGDSAMISTSALR